MIASVLLTHFTNFSTAIPPVTSTVTVEPGANFIKLCDQLLFIYQYITHFGEKMECCGIHTFSRV